MQKITSAQLASAAQNEWRKMLLLALMLLVFVANAVGLIEFASDLMPGIQIKFDYFRNAAGEIDVPAIMTSLEFVVLLGSGIILVIGLPLLSPIAASALVFVLAIPPVWIAIASPYRYNVVPMQFDLLVLLVLFGSNVLMKYFTETQEKQKLLNTFSQYLPPEVVKELSERSKDIVLAGEARFLTVMFCDLRNFTAMSEELKPQEVVAVLNEYFTAMTDILFRYGATIDKYVGDSIMAIWGAPLPQEDHVKRAVDASFDMHKGIERVAEHFHQRGLPTPSIGIGINSGVVNAGNMGSRHRLSYTVIGDAVNLAFRMQSITREYQVGTIVGEETASRYPEMLFRELDRVTLRGKSRLSRIYEPLGPKSSQLPIRAEQLAVQQRALASKYDNNLTESKRLFSELHEAHPDDGYYAIMREKLNT